jgi:hypothetical protein
MHDTCIWVPQNGIEGLAPFECVPRMLIVSACFAQALGQVPSDLVAEAVPFFMGSEPVGPVWSPLRPASVNPLIFNLNKAPRIADFTSHKTESLGLTDVVATPFQRQISMKLGQ